MTQEEKELLLKDLSARLPYGVKVQIIDDMDCVMVCKLDKETLNFIGDWEIRPYLRPMSSMTKEEEIEWFEDVVPTFNPDKLKGFCYKYHFDYFGLISRGLALEAKEGIYEVKQQKQR